MEDHQHNEPGRREREDPDDHRGRIGVVPPRYGREVVGGAEAVMSEVAHGLGRRGWQVDILTTCARDHFTWKNEYPPGVSNDDGVTIRRFPTVVDTDRRNRMRFEAALLSGATLTLNEQQLWVNDDLRVPELFHYLVDHARDYRALIFAPYLFWTTFACSQIAPERTILHPCLHDEETSRLEIFRPVFEGSAGIWFQTEPEHSLGHELFAVPRNHENVGCGIKVPETYDPGAFRERYGIEGPFVLFAGRREGAKGWDRMLNAFAAAVQRHSLPFSFVTMGTGPVNAPASIKDRVIDLGFVDSADLNNALAAASAYIQPSAYESFSRTIMEAWLAGTIVIANGACDVVRWHCDRSGAGLTYDDDAEFGECLAFVVEASAAAQRLAARGRAYVLENYTAEKVLDAQESTIRRWLPATPVTNAVDGLGHNAEHDDAEAIA